MNEKKTTYTRDTDKPFDDSDIDYSGIDNLSDDEVHEGAISDPDAQPVTKEQFKEFNRVSPTKKNGKLNEKNRVMHISGQPVRYEGQNTITLKSDTEAHKGAESDPDAPPLSVKAMAEFKRVNPFVKKNNV